MPSFSEPFKNWFGYTRRERRSAFILLILTVAIIGVRFILPDRKIEIKELHEGLINMPEDPESGEKATVLNYQPEQQKVYPQKARPKLDINTCDSAALEKLPGIGPVLSVRIVKYRNLLGGFSSTEQLREVYGLTEETFQLISGRIFADSSLVRKIQINTADYRAIIRLPYFDRYEVNAIMKYRELNGRIRGMRDLIDNKLIANGKAEKIRPYIDFGE